MENVNTVITISGQGVLKVPEPGTDANPHGCMMPVLTELRIEKSNLAKNISFIHDGIVVMVPKTELIKILEFMKED